MKRWCLRILAAFSLLLCIGTVVQWVRSYSGLTPMSPTLYWGTTWVGSAALDGRCYFARIRGIRVVRIRSLDDLRGFKPLSPEQRARYRFRLDY